jgi:hypothetical protein
MKKSAARKRQRHVGNSPSRLNRNLSQQSEFARDRALHVLAAMRRDSSLSLSRAAKAEGVKPETVKKNFPLALRKSGGKFRTTKSDRFQATLYLPDARGNSVPLQTRSSRERQQASQYLRDLGRYLRGQKNALARWHGKKIAGVELVTAGRTIVVIEPALSEFSLYRAFNGGGA